MTEFEILIIKLIKAINNEDLETTIDCVNSLNQLEYSNQTITQILRFNYDYLNYTNYFNNVCIDYVLENLNGINEAQEALFHKHKNKLAFNRDTVAIENFINNQLQEKTYNISDKLLVQGLIELAVQLNDRVKTGQMLDTILKTFGEEIM